MLNKIVVNTAFLYLPLCSLAQTDINNYKQNATEITGRHVTQEFEQDQNQEKNLISVLNLDVISYYGLSERYSTPLQKEVFKKTNDYKEKEQELKKIKQDLLSKPHYIDFEMTYYEQHNLEYNTTTHSFDFDVDMTLSKFYNQNYIQLGSIVFAKPQDVIIKNRQYEAGGLDQVRQTTGLIVSDADKALRIENNREHLRVLFLFHFTGVKPFKNNVIGFEFLDYFMTTKLDKIILYNIADGEVYKIYSPAIIKKK